MKLKDFEYQLPDNLIAQNPLHRRDSARLMIVDREKKKISHDIFSNIDHYLPKKSCLVLNDSKVIPARLLGRRSNGGGEVEIFLLKRLADGYLYETLLRPLKRLKNNEKIVFNNSDLIAEIKDKENRIVRFNKKKISNLLEKVGHMPLPPYIKRKEQAQDRKYYQTVYAKRDGSVASPTAGLHFTKPLINKLKKQRHSFEMVTLHINYATFKPVKENDITKHGMHFEDYSITKNTLNAVKAAKRSGRKVVTVGTTSCRVLETVGITHACSLRGSTNIFIYPGYHFQMTDILITNFHLPCSTLLMLVYAFGTKELMKRAYQEAIRKKYRFYSYGDAMLII